MLNWSTKPLHTANLSPMARHLSLSPNADSTATSDASASVAMPERPATRRHRNGRNQPNLRDVAKAADVSVATVSLVLNDSERISRATKLRVREIMDRLGYQPNRLAQSLSGKYVKTVAVMLPDLRHAFSDAYFGELLSGITDEAQTHGFKVLLEQAKPDYVATNKHVELFERRYVDGVLLLGHTDLSAYAADFPKGSYPAMAVDNRLTITGNSEIAPIDYVVSDYTRGAEQVMNYLLQLGHRTIGLLQAANEIATTRDVAAGWRRKLEKAGIAVPDTLTRDGRFTEHGGAEATAELLRDHPETTAILAGSDKMAIGALHYLQRRGHRVPQDISVVGFDDLPHAAFVNPSLTTIHLPLYEVGRQACLRLIERVEGRHERVAETMPTHLVIRDSTAIARTANGGT